MKICPGCLYKCDDSAQSCPRCHESLRGAHTVAVKKRSNTRMFIIILAIVIGVMFLFIFLTNSDAGMRSASPRLQGGAGAAQQSSQQGDALPQEEPDAESDGSVAAEATSTPGQTDGADGEQKTLSYDGTIYIGLKISNLENALQLTESNDEAGLSALAESGDVRILEQGTSVSVINTTAGGYVLVQVLDGDHQGIMGYVSQDVIA